MQPTPVIILPENVFQDFIKRIEALEKFKDEITTPPQSFTTKEAAQFLKMSEVGVRKARREHRLKATQRNAREWEFELSELERFKNRYNRPTW